MSKQTKKPKPVNIRNVENGQHTTLDAGTPNGLFEADNGSLYIVTHDDDLPKVRKFAIVLRHLNLESFTSLMLTDQQLEQGTWHGAYRLRLYHSFRAEAPVDRAGYACVSYDGLAMINCRGEKHHPRTLVIGNIGMDEGWKIASPPNDWRDFNGWEILPSEPTRCIFNRPPKGQQSWTVDVQPLAPVQ